MQDNTGGYILSNEKLAAIPKLFHLTQNCYASFDLYSRRGRSGNPEAKPRGIIRLNAEFSIDASFSTFHREKDIFS